MKILINLATLKSGGGQNVGLNFLSSLYRQEFNINKYFFMVARDSGILNFLLERDYQNIIIVPTNPLKRIIFEIFKSNSYIKKNNINIIYTYFGFGLFNKKIPQIIGSADSNLYYPDIQFWKGYKGFALIKRKLVDKFRIWGLKQASGIIFENPELLKRYKQLYNFTEFTKYIKPSVDVNYGARKYKLPKAIKTETKKGLFLCGWHLNKNIMIIPEIARIFKKNKVGFHFILTAPIDNSRIHQNFSNLVEKYEVQNCISVVGQVQKEELASLYEQIDFVFLLSKLESFSNNIIEAWAFERLLIISDEPWARAICQNSAFYVDRDSPVKIANSLINLLSDTNLYSEIINNGRKILKTYPDINEKTKSELEFLEFVYEKY